MVPLPVYSSDMSTSYSSLLRSMPVYQAHLNTPAFRSFAPAAGVYGGAPRPPGAPPPPGPAPRTSWTGAAAGAPPPRPKGGGGALVVRATANATPVQIIPFREAIAISPSRLVVRVTGGNIHDGAVRPRHRLEESQA